MRETVTAPAPPTANPPPPDLPGWPAVLRLAAAHRRRQQQLARAARDKLARLWRFVDPRDPQGSWAALNRYAVGTLSAAQTEAARGADEYVTAALAWQGATPDPVGSVAAWAFAGTAADGRDLAGLLGYPAFEVSAFVDQGMDPAQAAAVGRRHLERIAVTEVADAARVATGVAQVADRTVTGYVRMLTPPSCSRCVVLAGRFYRWNAGFQRHPQCDCVHIPAAEHLTEAATDPRTYFDSLSPAEQDATFGSAGAQAIRDGSDIARVVNARRGMYTAGGRLLTREATTRRGTGRRVRLMPEQILREAGGNRDEAIRLLRAHGYIL